MAVGSASWSFTEEDFGAITRALQKFLGETNARCALLVDRSGQLVATVGEQPNFDPTAFATLTAADFSANDELAQLIGQLVDVMITEALSHSLRGRVHFPQAAVREAV